MKINLQSDARKVRKYIRQRIKEYPIYENLGPGNDEDPIALITVGYYATQGGYVNLVFDTRPDAEVDGEWTLHIDNQTNTLPFPKWTSAYESIWEDESVSVVKYDGAKCKFDESSDDDALNGLIGEMLVAVLAELRDDGTLAKLPLSTNAYMVIEEFDGQFFWPTYDTRKSDGLIPQ